jgi:hypothetical protein
MMEYRNRVYPVYMHHVSQTVLAHLQQNHSDWIIENGLDRGLHINSNGTFVLQYPPTHYNVDPGRIW